MRLVSLRNSLHQYRFFGRPFSEDPGAPPFDRSAFGLAKPKQKVIDTLVGYLLGRQENLGSRLSNRPCGICWFRGQNNKVHLWTVPLVLREITQAPSRSCWLRGRLSMIECRPRQARKKCSANLKWYTVPFYRSASPEDVISALLNL